MTLIRKLIHISDIHVRRYSRHDEYREVFNALYDSLRQQSYINQSLIVVTGDICHSKTEMAPEQIQVISDFLRTLSTICPTVVISGNHDANLNAATRLDALTPIIENLNSQNLYYFKDSGVYTLHDINFYVWSVFGDRSAWPVPIASTLPNVGLIHAALQTAQTSLGYVVENNQYPLKMFDGFDMVLAGDIHLNQILQESPPIAFAGSLVQQNHGEALTGHGYFVWDVATKTIEDFVEVSNSYGFATITINTDADINIPALPKNVRLRVVAHENISDVSIKKLLSLIKKDHNILETSIQKKFSSTSSEQNISLVNNIFDIHYQNELISDYVSKHGVLSDIKDVIKLNEKFNAELIIDDFPKNIRWSPVKLKFDNIFSYKDSNEINFDNISGICGVFGSNAIGKSAIFNAICYSLFDKTPTCFKGSHIMNSRADSFYCELEFKVNDSTFIIERIGTRKKTGDVKVDVNFYMMDGNTRISLNGVDRRATNANIRSYVGSYDDFILTTLSIQNQNNLFIDIGQSERKDLLSQFMGLSIFDKLRDLADKDSKEIFTKLKLLRKDDKILELAKYQEALETDEIEYKKLEASLATTYADIANVSSEITKREFIVHSRKDIELIDIAATQSNINSLKYAREEAEAELAHEIKKYQLLEEQRKNIDLWTQDYFSEVESIVNKLLSAKKVVSKIENNINTLNSNRSSKKEQISDLEKISFNPACDVCIENNKSTIERLSTLKSECETILDELSRLEKTLYDGNRFIQENSLHEQRLNNYKLNDIKRLDLERKISESKLNVSKMDSSIGAFCRSLKTLSNSVESYNKNKDLINDCLSISDEIKQLIIERNQLAVSKYEIERNIKELYGQIEVIKNTKKEILRSIQEAEELESLSKSYEAYLKIMNRDGLPYDLINAIVPVLESEINAILSQIVSFTIRLETDGKNINSLLVYNEFRQWPLELASGMERVISSLAIRIALSHISNLPKTTFLLLDEILSPLDADNLVVIPSLFDYLKSKYSAIFLISHSDAIKDSVDLMLDIKRSDGYSQIHI